MTDEKNDEKTDRQIREEKTAAAVEQNATPANERMITALLRERAGLEVQGKTDRLAEVDKQLEHYGYKPDGTKADDGKSEARKQPPQGRSNRPQQKSDG